MNPDEIKYIDSKFEAQEKLLNAQKELLAAKTTHIMAETQVLIGDTNNRLDTIVKQNEVRNSRIEKNEGHTEENKKHIIAVEKKIDERNIICADVQSGKVKSNSTFWKILTAVIAISSIAAMIIIKRSDKQLFPIELFYQATDSTLHIPRMYMMRDDGELQEVSVDYFKFAKRKDTGQ